MSEKRRHARPPVMHDSMPCDADWRGQITPRIWKFVTSRQASHSIRVDFLLRDQVRMARLNNVSWATYLEVKMFDVGVPWVG